MTTLTAIVTQVKFGSFGSVEGLMYEDGSFAVGISQASSAFDVPQKNAARTVKTLLGEGLTILKTKISGTRITTNAISLRDFQQLVVCLAEKGNKNAQSFINAMFGASLQQAFSNAFKVQLSDDDFQMYISEYAFHNKNFHPDFTSWLKLDGIDGRKYGHEVNRLKACAGLPLVPITAYTSEQMRKLNTAETEYNVLRKIGKTHKEALAII